VELPDLQRPAAIVLMAAGFCLSGTLPDFFAQIADLATNAAVAKSPLRNRIESPQCPNTHVQKSGGNVLVNRGVWQGIKPCDLGIQASERPFLAACLPSERLLVVVVQMQLFARHFL
jgi:hypothetical protein